MSAGLILADAAPAASPTHPLRLGKYLLTGVLGAGAMGTVYKGIDPGIHRTVAVKAIRQHLFAAPASSVSASQRFRNEAQAGGKLSHPGIVSVYEYGEEDGSAYIAMEYVPGCTLAHYLVQPGRLAEADMLSVMVQLLEALHHAHEQGVWHRDVKPGNLIITGDGQLKVTDFGIARIEATALTQLQHTLLLIGSPGYIAPERYTGEAPDRRVDLFSCGVLLYQLLTGAPPFSGSDSEVMYQVLQQEPLAPSRARSVPPVPTGYDGIVARALAKRPADRYATALAFRDALLAVASGPVSRRLSASAVARVLPADGVATQRLHTPGLPPAAAMQPSSPSHPILPAAPVWDTALLVQLEALLTEHLGAVARPLVQRSAARCADLSTLSFGLADAAELSGADRERFASAVARLATPIARRNHPPGPPADLRHRPPTLVLEVTAAAPLRPEAIAQATALLASHIGPIAGLLVKKALAISGQREGFFEALADLAGSAMDRMRLREELSRIA